MLYLKKYSFCCLFLIASISIKAQDSLIDSKEALQFEASYTGDLVRNFAGGIRKGNVFMGLINISFTLNTKACGLWKNGSFYTQLQNTHGAQGITADYVGDIQLLSNIENGNYTYLYQMWYRQDFKRGFILTGIHDMNTEFLYSDWGGAFTSSSLGIMPAASMNIPVSIFPKNIFGTIINFELSNKLSIRTGFYDGDPGSLADDPFNLDWSMSKEQGFFSVSELWYKNDGKLSGTYKIGTFYHTGHFDALPMASYTDSVGQQGNFGVYGFIDQMLLPKAEDKEKGLAGFLIIGYAPAKVNLVPLYIGAGINAIGTCSKRPVDILAMGFSYASLYSNEYEAAIELNYQYQITESFGIQPAVHYIINPGGYANENNAFVGMLRINIGF